MAKPEAISDPRITQIGANEIPRRNPRPRRLLTERNLRAVETRGASAGIRAHSRYSREVLHIDPAKSDLSGVVLVGGRSRRMGRDKARLLWRGTPLWRRQLRVLARAGAAPVLLALRPRQRSFGLPGREIRDGHADAGPLSGLCAALSATTPASWVAVLAVDMPHVDAAWFRRLRARCRPGVGAVMVEPEGFEPLAAIYPRSALAVVARRLRRGHLALQGLVKELVRGGQMIAVPLPVNERWRAANWNEPGDMKTNRE